MRFMPVTVPLLIIAALPQVQSPTIPTLAPALTVTTTRPRVDVATTFKLVGNTTGGLWDFGDGSAPRTGGTAMSHSYRSADTFTVKVKAGHSTFHQTVTVVEPRRIVSTPSVPVPGKAAVLSLEEALGTSLVWTIGEGGRPVNGGASLSHTFPREGTYTVTVRDAAETPREFKVTIPVGLQGPAAPFSISYLALRWEDGTTERSVRQGESGLVAYADLKFEGTGQLQAEWLVDGLSQRALNRQLGFAKLTTLQSGRALPALQATGRSGSGNHTLATTIPGDFQIDLPTNVAGEHRVTLKVLQPRLTFPVPVLRYFVKLAGEAQGPVIQSISPASVTPGQEVELLLTGSGFTEDMALNLGKDVAALDKPQILSPGKALVKVFVSRSALPGTRTLQARKVGGSPSAPAKLEILLAGTGPTGTAAQLDSLKVTTLATTADRTKMRLSSFGPVPAGFRSPAVDLARAPRLSHAASRLVNVSTGTGFGMIHDANARVRQEKVPVCRDGQRLDLSKVALTAPSFSLIGVNTSGEFQSDDLPVLRDTTQFTWQEQNPGTSEYFELQFFTAKAGAPLKTLKVPGNRHSYDVAPSFVQELSRLYAATDLVQPDRSGTRTAQANKAAKGLAPGAQGATGTFAHQSTMVNSSGSAGAQAHTPQTLVNASGSSTAKAADHTLAGIGIATKTSETPGLASSIGKAMEPDLVIPGPMQKKAQVVWRVLGFRSYPCLTDGAAEDEKKATPSHTARTEKAIVSGYRVTAAALSGPPSQTPSQSASKRMSVGSQSPLAASARSRSLDTSLAPDRQSMAVAQLSSVPRVYQSVAVEVSRSGVWPLRMPVAAQGVTPNGGCAISQNDPKVVLEPNRSGNNGGGMYMNLSSALAIGSAAGSKPKNSLDENTYVYDEVWLHGTFDLGSQKVPYRLIPSSVLPKGTTAAGAALQAIGDAIQNLNNQIGDAIQNLNNSTPGGPFLSSSTTPPSGQSQSMIAKAVGLVTFKNVFVDWGDGTIEPFSGYPLDTLLMAANGTTTGTNFYSTYKVDAGTFKHTYLRGAIEPPYRVKVYVLSDEDMGRSDLVGQVAQALTPVHSTKGVFTRLSGMATTASVKPVSAIATQGSTSSNIGKGFTSNQASPAIITNQSSGALLHGLSSANQALGRAYVVFCHDFRVVEREDPCANGPLNLVAVELEFPKNEAPAPKAVDPKAGGNLSGAFASKALDPRTAVNPSGGSTTKEFDPKTVANLSGGSTTKEFDPKTVANLSGSSAAKAPDPKGVVNASGTSANKSLAQKGLGNRSASSDKKLATSTPAGPNPPSTTPCNLFYSVATRVKYYGQGTVRVIWKVDGHQVGSREVPVKSPKRTGLKANECLTCLNPTYGELPLISPALPVDSLGRHIVAVEADVLPDKSGDADFIAITDQLQGFTPIPAASHRSGSGASRDSGSTLSPRSVHTLAAILGKSSTSRNPVHLGLLNPSQAPGQPAYVSLSQVAGMADLQKAVGGLLEPPYHVLAEGLYEVKEAQPGQKCNLSFPTKGGNFVITNLGSTLKLVQDGALTRASGKGLLVLGVKAGTAPDAVAPYPLDLSFSNWKLDNTTVVQGQINLKPNQPYNGPGVSGSLLEVHGAIADQNALQDLRAKLKLSPIDTSIVSGDGAVRPEWIAEAPITTQGDWIATKGLDEKPLQLATSKLGPTPWFFSAEGVTIDLSGIDGTDPNGGSPQWVGVRLGTVTVVPATLGIQTGQWSNHPLPQPKNWTIEGLGVKGKLDTGAWQADYRDGHLAIANIHFEGTKEGHYSAYYTGVEIRSPWFKDPIKGDASWFKQDGAGNYALNLDKLHVNKRPTLAGGPLSLDPLDLQFVQIKAGGLLLQGRAHLTLKAEDKPLATFDVDRVGFGLDGLLYFGDDGQRNTTVTLNTTSTLGLTPAELQTAVLTGGNAKETPLDLLVSGKLRLSANPVIPGTPVAMHYSLKASGSPGTFTAPEVKVDPFSMDVSFPMGSPSMQAKIATNYQPGGTVGGAPALAGNRFNGSVNLSLFGGAPVKAQFVLGYAQGKDYFATRVDVPLGPSGVVIIPEIVSLYRLSGGFAYNFGPDVFVDGGSITNAQPDFKGVTQFMAGARLGSGDGFIYTLDGQLVIGSTGTARMDLAAWLLAHNPSGSAPLKGQLTYANGNFDGAIWGGYSFLDGQVSLNLGTAAAPSCSLHFGGGSWHVYAGNRNGSRIAGTLFGNSTEAYLMLGSDVGLAVGGRQNWYFGAGVGVKAYAKGWMDMGLQITPQPKIVGDFSAGLEAGICIAKVGCLSAGVSAHVHAEALPVSVSADCCIDLPWPFSEACFTVKM